MTTLKLKEALQEKEEKFHFKDDIFGMTLLTQPGYISSSRGIMFTSHLRQFVNLKNPDFPYVFSNYENIVGKHSTGYYKADKDLEVIAKIPKFENGHHDGHIYLLFVYDKKNDRYDVIQKRIVEDLTEKFGFAYNNEVMDRKDVGDSIKKNEVLYKTTSYDDDMNYCYGKNVKFAYMLHNNTIEDAIVVSESFAKSMVSKEVETIKISLNDNDILCNIYGDSEEYKCFPNINEFVEKKIVCAKRRIHNTQLLYDLKKSNLRKINFSSDVLSYSEGRGKVVDINIYCNKPLDKIDPNNFNEQLLDYLHLQSKFYEKVLATCTEIIGSGSKYSNDINFWFKKAKNVLDENYKWREEDNSVFSNMIVEFTIERDVSLSVGQKITGRYGNKGVVSKIVPDDEMPVLDDGSQVHIIFNSLGVINRLNSQQLYEQSITFICNRTRERLKTMDSLDEKEKLLTRLIWYFNPEQSEKMKKYIKGLNKSSKEGFFEKVMTDGIYIHIPPLWEETPIFDKLIALYDEFDWIKPYDVYIQKFGRKIKIMKPLIVGDMYVIKLKQASKKGFSARSTGSLSKKGVPEKSNKAKTHQELYSKTPIRIGDQENVNSAIGVDTHVLAKLHLFYRSSISGRRYLGEELTTTIKELEKFIYNPDFSNRNVEILQALLRAMGLQIEFSEDKMTIDIYLDRLESYEHDGMIMISTRQEFEDFVLESNVRKKYEDSVVFVGTNEEFEEQVKKDVEIEKWKKTHYVIDVELPETV